MEKKEFDAKFKNAVRMTVEVNEKANLTDEEFEVLYYAAREKRDEEILKEGDLHGMRNQPWYLALMICEIIHGVKREDYDEAIKNYARKLSRV